LLDQENSLWASAGNSESKGDTLGAKKIYQQVADLNGDKGSLALAAVARLSRIIDPPPPAKKPDTHSTHGKAGSSGKTETASKRSEKNASESCQLIPSDVIRHLERADRYRGSGLYSDAERLYKDVLACEPNNDRATAGLARTRKALEVEPK